MRAYNNIMFDIYNLEYIEIPRIIIRPISSGDEHDISAAIQVSLQDLQR